MRHETLYYYVYRSDLHSKIFGHIIATLRALYNGLFQLLYIVLVLCFFVS